MLSLTLTFFPQRLPYCSFDIQLFQCSCFAKFKFLTYLVNRMNCGVFNGQTGANRTKKFQGRL